MGAGRSGTSFLAPKVAVAIAQEMYLNVDPATKDLISADQAWRRLSSHQRLRCPDLGVVINVSVVPRPRRPLSQCRMVSLQGHADRDVKPDAGVSRGVTR